MLSTSASCGATSLGLRATIIILVLAMAVLISPASAAVYTLSSGNSTVTIDPASPYGMTSWVVDGVNQLAEQWWYYRIGETGVALINTLGNPVVTQTNPRTLTLQYYGQFVDFSVKYTLMGGPVGSGTASIGEQASIKNKTAALLPFHLFEYTDLNLNNTIDDDRAVLLNSSTVAQWDGSSTSTESAAVGGITPLPDRWELTDAQTLVAKLNSGGVIDLANACTPFTGDAAFAFQWDMSIPAGGTRLLSKSKLLMRGGAIGDTVWYDSDGNGVQDDGELGIEGVTVTLEADFDGDGTIDFSDSRITDESGYYLFPNLPAGKYAVIVNSSTLPTGAVQTYDLDGLDTPHTATIQLLEGEVNLDVDYGYRQFCSVGDRVWIDANGDGVQDAGEAGINGATVNLLDAHGSVIATTMTAGDGIYNFTGLSAGTYQIVVDHNTIPSNLVQTYDLDMVLDHSATLVLAAGDNRTDVDFGYRFSFTQKTPDILLVKTGPATACVGDTITYHFVVTNTGETNLDITVNDPLLGGVIWQKGGVVPGEVNEFDAQYVVRTQDIAVKTSNSFGLLCHTPNPPPPAYILVNTATATGVPPSGENVTSTSSCTTEIVTPRGSIGDRVWKDLNANGIQDAGEPGINGVKVVLRNSAGTIVATAYTSGYGNYKFSNLKAGTYTAGISYYSLPPGLKGTYELDGSLNGWTRVTLAVGQNRTDVDFGYVCNQPKISLVKSGPATAKIGDKITYHFKVTNTGNTVLNIVVNDPLLGGIIWSKNGVAPGAVNEFDRTYVVKASDCQSGESSFGLMCVTPNPPTCTSPDTCVLVNSATAIGTSQLGGNVYSQSSCKTTINIPTNYTTYTQGGWGSNPNGNNPGALLAAKFCKVYPGGYVSLGGYYKLKFYGAAAVRAFLPQGGRAGMLRCSAVNPTSSSAGVFAGQVLALKLNVDFSNAGITTPGLGSVKLTSGPLAGKTIAQVLAIAEQVLGGNDGALPGRMTISQLNDVVDGINNRYK